MDTTGVSLTPADVAALSGVCDAFYWIGVVTGLLAAPVVGSVLRWVWRRLGMPAFRFVVPHPVRMRFAFRFVRWVQCMKAEQGFRLLTVREAERIRKGGAN